MKVRNVQLRFIRQWKKRLEFPLEAQLEGTDVKVPYYFIGDEAFALADTLIKPFSGIHPKGSFQRIFNYRLSRARRVVENVFGIASASFRVLRQPMLLEPNKAELVIMAVAHLHNSVVVYTHQMAHSTKKLKVN